MKLQMRKRELAILHAMDLEQFKEWVLDLGENGTATYGHRLSPSESASIRDAADWGSVARSMCDVKRPDRTELLLLNSTVGLFAITILAILWDSMDLACSVAAQRADPPLAQPRVVSLLDYISWSPPFVLGDEREPNE